MARRDPASGDRRGDRPLAAWSPTVARGAGPLYLAIADAIAADVARGALRAGTRLPSQRTLAARLGVDFTTVTRAYAEARRRGLVDGKVGQGTWVLERPAGAMGEPAAPAPGRPPDHQQPSRPPERRGLIDMSMNLPPPVDGAAGGRLWESIAAIGREGGADLLMRYQEPGGGAEDREAGALWLSPRLPGADPARILACPGAQSALLAACHALCQRGDAIAAATLVYPGLIATAKVLGLRLVAVDMDDGGPTPEALDAVCAAHAPRVFYCNPTLSSPTTRTLSLQRRQALVAVAARHGVSIIEDDAYGALAPEAPPALARLAPENVIHIAGMAKSVAPALRVAWLTAPDIRCATRLAAAIGATTLMASPLTLAIAATWIRNGQAASIRDAIRAETAARVAMARRILPPELAVSDPDAFHLWLHAPAPWGGADLAGQLRAAGVAAVPAGAFAIGPAPQALRLGLGVPASRADLERCLYVTADLLARAPGFAMGVV